VDDFLSIILPTHNVSINKRLTFTTSFLWDTSNTSGKKTWILDGVGQKIVIEQNPETQDVCMQQRANDNNNSNNNTRPTRGRRRQVEAGRRGERVCARIDRSIVTKKQSYIALGARREKEKEQPRLRKSSTIASREPRKTH